MFKGFQDTSRSPMFRGFPNLNFQMNNERFGLSGAAFDLNPLINKISSNADGASISYWTDDIGGYKYIQDAAASQPIYDASDANFNNLPVVGFNSTTTVCNLTVTTGAGIGISKASSILCVVYQRAALAAGTNRVARITWGTDLTAAVGQGFLYDAQNAALTGKIGMNYTNGSANSALLTNTGYDANPHIVLINNEKICVDGAIATNSDNAGNYSTTAYRFGGVNSGTQSGHFILARFIVWEGYGQQNDLFLTGLSDIINQTYAIY